MKRLWKSLSQRISWALRKTDIENVDGMIESLKRQYHKIESPESEAAFWRYVAYDLQYCRRWGRWEGADIARAILKPHIRAEGGK